MPGPSEPQPPFGGRPDAPSPSWKRRWGTGAWLAAALLAHGTAAAHDSWLTPAAAQRAAGLLQLELVSGPRFPQRESGPAAGSVVRPGCRSGADRADQPLQPRQEHATHLELRSRVDTARGAACWLELRPHEVEMTPELVKAYFSEIRPPAALAELWSRQQARGVPWRESYRKSIRLELPAAGEHRPQELQALRQPQGLALEIVPIGSEPIRPGQPTDYQLLLDGKPLPEQWVEFVSERSPLGVWRQSDARGQVRQALPFGGRWLLRATRLEAPAQDGEPWRSRFGTLLVHAR